MSFETREKDLLARIGKLRTKNGMIETPLLFPVVNPSVQFVSPRKLRDEFGFQALITNAYILKRRMGVKLEDGGLHKFLDFDGPIMTDSGAYQILVYGEVDIAPEDIVEYQESIGSDIATILDIPTGWEVTETCSKNSIEETLNRARDLFRHRKRDGILWVGPVQGGRYLTLIAESARQMGKLDFDIHALGSPTEVMERYRFDNLVDMIVTAKSNLPLQRPLHLFGAGHPFMFSLAVALGCDLFDSAAYALYARENRYMTETGTSRLNELEYFPCSCKKCAGTTPKNVLETPAKEKQIFLAEHNLYACAAELRRIKQAIREGRLWELVQIRARGHPSILQAVKQFKRYEKFIEKHDPSVKNSGLFFFDSTDLARPEIAHYTRRLMERTVRTSRRILLLLPQTKTKPFHKSMEFKKIVKQFDLKKSSRQITVCFYAAPFGVIPLELDEVYPLSQHETVLPLDTETIQHVSDCLERYIPLSDCTSVILVEDRDVWQSTISHTVKEACKKKKVPVKIFNLARLPGNAHMQKKLEHPAARPDHTYE